MPLLLFEGLWYGVARVMLSKLWHSKLNQTSIKVCVASSNLCNVCSYKKNFVGCKWKNTTTLS